MITWADVRHVLEATVPLYASMILAYASVRWWKLFTPEECSVINKFVSKISIPLLSYQVISANNPYQMNLELLLADVVQKLLALLMFAALSRLYIKGSLDLLITVFSVTTLPNTLIVGIPLLRGMYGEEAARLLGQIVALQSLVWYTLLLFLFELRAARVNPSTGDDHTEEAEHDGADTQVQKTSKACLVLLMVGRKLMTNPNTYSCIAGLAWSLISFRWGVALPSIVENSINILANGGLGMAMFSLGLFMASQSTVMACSARKMVLSTALRFVAGPALMAIPCYAEKMRGRHLSVAIIQAALPQGIVPFVFAKDYGVYPEVLSTGVIVGMLLAVPVALVYSIIVDHN